MYFERYRLKEYLERSHIIEEPGVLESFVSVRHIQTNKEIVSRLIDTWEYRWLYLDWYRLKRTYRSKGIATYLSIPSILYIFLSSRYLVISIYIHLPICVFICLSVSISVYLYIYLSISLSLYIYLSIYLPSYQFISLSIYISIYLSMIRL